MNPEDTFPRRELPPEAQEWGRKVEDALYELSNRVNGNGDATLGLNRNTAASLETLAGQVRTLSDQVTRVNDLYNSLPIAFQRTDTNSGFGLSSAGWNTVASISFVPPSNGTLMVTASMSGQLVSDSTDTNMEIEVRLLRGTGPSPEVPGLPASPDGVWVNNFTTQWGWSVNADPDRPVVIQAQIDPVTSASWGSGTGSFVVLSGFATFVPA